MTKSYVVIFPSIYPRQHVRTLVKNIRQVLHIQQEPFTSIRRDGDIILVDAHDPVFASSVIGSLFGVERIVIARQTDNVFDDIVDTVHQLGGSLLLGNETFLVRVEGYSRGFLPKDVEMAATGRIIETKSSLGARPGTPERYDKLLYVYMTKRYAYISIYVDGGMGGLPTGTQGRAVCCVFDEISAAACYETMRMGFDVRIVACYVKESDINRLARVVDRLIPFLLTKFIPMTFHKICPVSSGYGDMAASSTQTSLYVAHECNATHVGLPLSRMAFAGPITDVLADRVYQAGLVPLSMLGDHGRVQHTLVQLNLAAKSPGVRRIMGRTHACGAEIPSTIPGNTINVKAGPNSLHDMLDSLHQTLEF